MKLFPLLLLIMVLASCSTSQDVVQDGPFQKRKYFKKGWFFDRPIKRGMEELENEAPKVAEAEPLREPYLEVIPQDLVAIEDLDLAVLPELHMRTELILMEEEEAPVVRAAPRSKAVRSLQATMPPGHHFLRNRPGPLEVGYGMALPLLSTGLTLLLPAALIIALLIIVQRVSRVSDHGSMAAMLALFMGIAALAALAAI